MEGSAGRKRHSRPHPNPSSPRVRPRSKPLKRLEGMADSFQYLRLGGASFEPANDESKLDNMKKTGTHDTESNGLKQSDTATTEVIDGETGKVDPSPLYHGAFGKAGRRIDLSTLRDVRLEMARVYRMMDAGEIEDASGTKRVYALEGIGKVITVAEIERRIQELEDRQGRPALPAPTTAERTLN